MIRWAKKEYKYLLQTTLTINCRLKDFYRPTLIAFRLTNQNLTISTHRNLQIILQTKISCMAVKDRYTCISDHKWRKASIKIHYRISWAANFVGMIKQIKLIHKSIRTSNLNLNKPDFVKNAFSKFYKWCCMKKYKCVRRKHKTINTRTPFNLFLGIRCWLEAFYPFSVLILLELVFKSQKRALRL